MTSPDSRLVTDSPTAVVLSAGASWAAYQVGVLRTLDQRAARVGWWAGTGIGAMNAALAACGELAALEDFWDGLTVRRLLTVARPPSRAALFSGAPQRRFVRAHVSEARLAAHDAVLLVSTLDLRTGRIEVLRYPGSEVPLVDGLMAAVATSGITPPLSWRGTQLAEGTFANSLLVGPALATPAEQVLVVAPVGGAAPSPGHAYRTWRAVLERALALDQSADARRGAELAAATGAAAEAFRRVSRLTDTLPALAPDAVREQLATDLAAAGVASRFPLRRSSGPRTVALTPDLPYPMWRFRAEELRAAVRRGAREADLVLQDAA